MNTLNLKGTYTFEIIDKNNTVSYFVHNGITTVGKEMVSKLLSDSVQEGLFQYIGFGDSNTAFNVSDIKLSSEVGRVEVLSKTYSENTITVTAQVPNDELVGFTLQEIGIFGIEANATLDSGFLFSRAVLSPTIIKTNTKEINVTYILTIN